MKRIISFVLTWAFSLVLTSAHDAKVYLEHPIAEFALIRSPRGNVSEFVTSFGLGPDAFGRDLAFRLRNDPSMRQDSRVEVWVNGLMIHSNPVHVGRDAWSVIPFNFLRLGKNDLAIRLPGGFPHKFRGIEFLSHQVTAGLPPMGEQSAPFSQVLEVYLDRDYDPTGTSVTLWALLTGKDMMPVSNAQGSVAVNGKKYSFRFAPGAFSGLKKWGYIYSQLPGRFEVTIPLSDLAGGINPAQVVFQAGDSQEYQDWYPLRSPDLGRRTASPERRLRLPILFRHSMNEAAPRAWLFEAALPDRPEIVADLQQRTAPGRIFEYNEVAALLRTIHGMGGSVFLASEKPLTLRRQFADYIYLLDVDGFGGQRSADWDPAVEAGSFWDQLLHAGHRFWLDGGKAGAPFAATGSWTMAFDIAGAAPGATASMPVGSPVEVRIRLTATAPVARVELISDVKGTPGEVIATWESDEANRELRHHLTAGNGGYFRLRAVDGSGNQLYSNPVFLEVRGTVVESVVARVGTPTLLEAEASPAPAAATVRIRLPQDQVTMPMLMSESSTRTLQVEFTPATDGYHLLEAGLDPRKALNEGKSLRFSVVGGSAKTYRAFQTANLAEPKLTRNLVPFRFELGFLKKGVPTVVTLEAGGGGDGIAVTHLFVIRSSFPVHGLTDMHQHSLAADEYGSRLSRTMGYSYVGTGHAHDEKERTGAGSYSDDSLIIQAAGEVNNGFGSCHVALAFPEATNAVREAWSNSRDNSFAAAFDMSGAPILNHPYSDRRFAWVQKSRDWGVSEEYFHGYAGWDHLAGHYGWVEQQWRLLTLFELFNGYDGHGRMAGRKEVQTNAEAHWHEELNDFVYGRRRAPIFAVAGSDLKTFFKNYPDHYIGNVVSAAAFDRPSFEAATFAGRSHLAAAAHVRMLVSVTDARGNVYLPGNRIVGPGPYQLHVEAWSPKPLTQLRIVHPGGIREEIAVNGQFIARDIPMKSLPPFYWFYVLVRGDEPRTTALSNPFFAGFPFDLTSR